MHQKKVKSLKLTIDLHCLIPPNRGFNDPSVFPRVENPHQQVLRNLHQGRWAILRGLRWCVFPCGFFGCQKLVVFPWLFWVVFGASKNLVGGFNPSEKWRQIGSFPQVGGENKKSLKQPPRMLRAFKMTKIMEMMRTLYWWIHEHWDENLGGSTWKRGLQETTQEIESGDLWCTCMNHFGWGSINITNHETLQMSKDRDSSIPSILSLHVY